MDGTAKVALSASDHVGGERGPNAQHQARMGDCGEGRFCRGDRTRTGLFQFRRLAVTRFEPVLRNVWLNRHRRVRGN